jgi:hypothetical protein
MRQAIVNLLEAARVGFGAKTPASPSASHLDTEPVQTPFKPTAMNITFTRSPLADAADDLSPRTIDAVLAIFADGDVQRQAAAVRAKLLHVIEFAALRSEIALAVKAVGTHSNDGLTPAAVVAVLRQRAAELDEMLEDARADKDSHEAARSARTACIEPLRREVSKRLSSLIAERESCLMRLDAHRRAQTLGLASNGRFNALLAVGISAEAIASLGVEDPTVQENKLRARIADIHEEIKPLTRFTTGGDVADLGMDALIALAHPDRVGAEASA